MKFVDQIFVRVQSGKGGAGCCSFRREKFVAKGGPNGGDGGRGGHVIFRGEEQMATLLDFRFKREYIAASGSPGGGSHRQGKDAEDVILKVPLGTLIIHADTEEVLADVITHQQDFVVARGGLGGRGNARFKTAVNRAPRRFDIGEPGVMLPIKLELKLLADVGLVGCPNAGKSSLIRTLSLARPKVACYPFTTLNPVLGVVNVEERGTFVVADIPGLIRGAHTGTGLGDTFLRHVERCRLLVFVIDISGFDNDPWEDCSVLLNEIKSYKSSLEDKPRIYVLNKVDIGYNKDVAKIFLDTLNEDVLFVSAATGEGCWQLKERMFQSVKNFCHEH